MQDETLEFFFFGHTIQNGKMEKRNLHKIYIFTVVFCRKECYNGTQEKRRPFAAQNGGAYEQDHL